MRGMRASPTTCELAERLMAYEADCALRRHELASLDIEEIHARRPMQIKFLLGHSSDSD